MRRVYLSSSGSFLPGPPISVDAMEDHIGRISAEASRRGRLTLRQNRIVTRHYAIDADGNTDWTVAKLAAAAVEDLLDRAEIDRREIGFLATATTQNDILVPGLASGVQAALGRRLTPASRHGRAAQFSHHCQKSGNAAPLNTLKRPISGWLTVLAREEGQACCRWSVRLSAGLPLRMKA